MGFTALSSADIAVDKPITNELMDNIKNDLDFLYGQVGSQDVILANGSFEIDSDADGTPDGWTKNLYAGGAGALTTAITAHGQRAMEFTQSTGAGNGGGNLMSDYISYRRESAPIVDCLVKFSSGPAAGEGLRWQLKAAYYDKDKTLRDTAALTTLATGGSTNWTRVRQPIGPGNSSDAFVKLKLIGGATGGDTAGSMYYDNVRLETLPPVSKGNIALCLSNSYTTLHTSVSTILGAVKVMQTGTYKIKCNLANLIGAGSSYDLYLKKNSTIISQSTKYAVNAETTWTTSIAEILFPGDSLEFWVGTNAGATNTTGLKLYNLSLTADRGGEALITLGS